MSSSSSSSSLDHNGNEREKRSPGRYTRRGDYERGQRNRAPLVELLDTEIVL